MTIIEQIKNVSSGKDLQVLALSLAIKELFVVINKQLPTLTITTSVIEDSCINVSCVANDDVNTEYTILTIFGGYTKYVLSNKERDEFYPATVIFHNTSLSRMCAGFNELLYYVNECINEPSYRFYDGRMESVLHQPLHALQEWFTPPSAYVAVHAETPQVVMFRTTDPDIEALNIIARHITETWHGLPPTFGYCHVCVGYGVVSVLTESLSDTPCMGT